MIEAQSLGMACADSIGAMGAGILLGVLYHVLRFLSGNSRHSTTIRDLVFAPIAAVFSFSYAVTYSFAGTIRWYIILFILVGILCYRTAVMKKTFVFETYLRRKLKRFFLLLRNYFISKIQHIVCIAKEKHNNRKVLHKNRKKQLQKGCKVLYNSDKM